MRRSAVSLEGSVLVLGCQVIDTVFIYRLVSGTWVAAASLGSSLQTKVCLLYLSGCHSRVTPLAGLGAVVLIVNSVGAWGHSEATGQLVSYRVDLRRLQPFPSV